MSIPALKALLATHDIKLVIRPAAGRLRVDAPVGALTPEILAAIRAHKAEILESVAPFEMNRYVPGLSPPRPTPPPVRPATPPTHALTLGCHIRKWPRLPAEEERDPSIKLAGPGWPAWVSADEVLDLTGPAPDPDPGDDHPSSQQKLFD